MFLMDVFISPVLRETQGEKVCVCVCVCGSF